jgi:hypothetical protein
MSIQCPTSLRRNPANASYCYYDGRGLHHAALKGPLGLGARPFPLPFSFSDGRGCSNFNQLVLACDQHWNEARGYLLNGTWKSFFGAIGRTDLAALAVQSAKEADADVGLCRLLEGLPADAEALRPPKLALTSSEENLGALEPGKDYKIDLTIVNQGMFLLRGSVTTDCDWLSLGNPQTNGSAKLFQTRDTYPLPVRVLGSKLRAQKAPLEGQIAIDTNGGRQTVAVRATVPIRPFPRGQTGNGALADAVSPREIAVKAKAHPQEAAVLFEQGAVKAWYESNGWTYPVRGTQAKGKSAVQQFFEALGLSKPPHLEINTQHIDCQGYVGECLTENAIVHTAEAKYVHAEAYSSQEWIKVLPVKPQGKSVTIPLRIEIPPRPGETLEGSVTVLGNGQQRFDVAVKLAVASQSVQQELEKAARSERRLLSLASVVVLVGLVIAAAAVLKHRSPPPENPSSEQIASTNSSSEKTASSNPSSGKTANGAAMPDPSAPPPATGKHWWDNFQGTSLTASVRDLKKAAGNDRRIFERIESDLEADRQEGYEQLAIKRKELARKPQMRNALGRFVAECCVFEPSDTAIDPLLGDLDSLFPRVFKVEDVELVIFWLAVVCEAIGHPDARQARSQRLTRNLGNALGVDLDPRDPPKVIKDKAETALARTCYGNLPLTAESSIEHALTIRKVLIEKFGRHLKLDYRDKQDELLLGFLQRKEDVSVLDIIQIVQWWYVEDGAGVPKKLVQMLDDRLQKLKPEQMKELRPLLSHKENAEIVLVVLKAVQTRKEGAAVVAAEVVDLIQHPAPKVRESALQILKAMGAAVEETLPDFSQRLLPLLQNKKDKSIVVTGLQVVQARKAKAANLAKEVTVLSKDEDATVRAAALNALLAIGPAAAEAGPKIAELLERLREEKIPEVRQVLDNLLKDRLATLEREQMIVELRPLLADKDSAFVLVGLKVVQERKAKAADVAVEVADALKRSDEKEVREQALKALQALGSTAEKALPKLFELLDNPRTPQRTALALTMADIVDPKNSSKTKRLVPVLLKGLNPEALANQAESNESKINRALLKIGQPAVDGCIEILNARLFGPNADKKENIHYRRKLYETLAKLGPTCRSQRNYDEIKMLWKGESSMKHSDPKAVEAVGGAMNKMEPKGD